MDLVFAEEVLESRSVTQHLEGAVGLSLGCLFAPESKLTNQGEDQGEGDHAAESPVKLFCDCHCLFHLLAMSHDQFPLAKRISTTSVASWPGSYFHCLTAFCAASMSSGCPPRVFTDLTCPLGATSNSSLTAPEMFILLASSGY